MDIISLILGIQYTQYLGELLIKSSLNMGGKYLQVIPHRMGEIIYTRFDNIWGKILTSNTPQNGGYYISIIYTDWGIIKTITSLISGGKHCVAFKSLNPSYEKLLTIPNKNTVKVTINPNLDQI